jgi:hypothetical protein
VSIARQANEIGREQLSEFIRRRGGTVTVREIMQSYWPLKNQREKAEAMLSELVTNGLARWDDVKTTAKGGRPTRKLRLLPREIPVVHMPGESPQPYSTWTHLDKKAFGIRSPRTQWQFLQRIAKGMSVKQAAEDMGLRPVDVQRFIFRTPFFKASVERFATFHKKFTA